MKDKIITATLPAQDTYNAKNLSVLKETVNTLQVVTVAPKDHWQAGELVNPVSAVFYMGRSFSASIVYCSIWVHTADGRSVSGHGTAGGWGYHKESAALQDAISSAGIKLSKSVHGVGENAMRDALLAITKAAGYRSKKTLIV